MVESCPTCQEILSIERALAPRVEAVIGRVLAICVPIREENADRWRAFAERCGRLFGRRFQRKHLVPVLAEEPPFFEEAWYRAEGGAIETEARRMESLKKGHLEHWGEESVLMDDGDPQGSVVRIARARCYELGHRPFLPDIYDFSSGSSFIKYETPLQVMCASTLGIVDRQDCRWGRARDRDGMLRPVYWLRSAPRPPFPLSR
ncbi:MAG TPA: hypothetical protein VL283_00740 [Candidatus Baltobacteraceae bacterium]|nr:hypothetical protein [Candidatus Baltobacteraceae bacterium]